MAAARPKYNLASQQPNSLVFTALQFGTLQAFIANTATGKLVMPCRGKIIGVRLNYNREGGTFSVATLNVLVNAVGILTAAFDVAAMVAGTPADKEVADLTAAAADVPANSEITFTTAESGGTSPTWADVTIQIDYVPLGG